MPERTYAPEPVLFEETQRMGAWFWLAIGAGGIGMLIATGSLIRTGAPGRTPGLIGLGLGLIALIASVASRLITRVTAAGVSVRYPPFPIGFRLAPAEIADVALKQFGVFDWPGGLGYHISFGATAATARTGTGVLIRRRDGRQFLIGTQRPDALLAAVRQLQQQAER